MKTESAKIDFERFRGFVRETQPDFSHLTDSQKAALNRRGNEFVNRGEIDDALRVFCATGYRDGIIRVADAKLAKGDEIGALAAYAKAGCQRGMDPICEKLAAVISEIIA